SGLDTGGASGIEGLGSGSSEVEGSEFVISGEVICSGIGEILNSVSFMISVSVRIIGVCCSDD
ncbi:hypothetical protein A2U01_0105406, partial [Trifolium medium]|nr:hypothetical protein [Trifolium medium]